jgi:CheY-like chemotaxis protein
MRALTVLIVDDDSEVRQLLADGFRCSGHDVLEAGDGRIALDLLVAGIRPDVIVLDVMMPVMDGLTFLAHKRDAREFSAIPVVVVSATARGPIDGAHSVLGKPFDFDDLIETVHRCSLVRAGSVA